MLSLLINRLVMSMAMLLVMVNSLFKMSITATKVLYNDYEQPLNVAKMNMFLDFGFCSLTAMGFYLVFRKLCKRIKFYYTGMMLLTSCEILFLYYYPEVNDNKYQRIFFLFLKSLITIMAIIISMQIRSSRKSVRAKALRAINRKRK